MAILRLLGLIVKCSYIFCFDFSLVIISLHVIISWRLRGNQSWRIHFIVEIRRFMIILKSVNVLFKDWRFYCNRALFSSFDCCFISHLVAIKGPSKQSVISSNILKIKCHTYLNFCLSLSRLCLLYSFFLSINKLYFTKRMKMMIILLLFSLLLTHITQVLIP